MTEIAGVVEARDALGECCLWCPTTRRVWWLDIQKPTLQSYDPVTREHRVYPLPGKHCGCAALRRSGGLVLALDHGLSGALEAPSAYFMKSPPVQHRDEDARHMVEAFIAEFGQAAAVPEPMRTRDPALVAD